MMVTCSIVIYPRPIGATSDAAEWQWRKKVALFFPRDLKVKWAGFIGWKLVGKEAMKGQLTEILEAYEFANFPTGWTGNHLYPDPDPGTWNKVGEKGHETSVPLFFNPDRAPGNKCTIKEDTNTLTAEIMCSYLFVDCQLTW